MRIATFRDVSEAGERTRTGHRHLQRIGHVSDSCDVNLSALALTMHLPCTYREPRRESQFRISLNYW
jgi:hypothetical protein